MNRHLITLLLLLFVYGAWAQEQGAYYYCKSRKIPLVKQPTHTVADKLTQTLLGKIPLVKQPTRSMSTMYADNCGKLVMSTKYIYVKIKSEEDISVLYNTAEKYGLSVESQDEFMPLWFVLINPSFPDINSVDISNEIYETGLFEECSPDFIIDGKEISYDPYIKEQWGLYNYLTTNADICVSDAWNYSTGKGVVIAIVDEGIELTHVDLAPNIYHKSYDAMTGTSPSLVYGNHGTHCAGIAAAVRNNGTQISGVAPDAKLMSVSNNIDESELCARNMARGINWAWKNGADVISMSWACMDLGIVRDAIDSALVKGRNGKGCVLVKSAGNGHKPYITFPGTCEGVISVANMTKYGEINSSKANGSNYGDEMFVSAPGTVILSTVLNNSIDFYTGTSMAAPHVAGVAALMLERNSNLTVWQVREIIARTAKKLKTLDLSDFREYGAWSKYCGYGLIDAHKAVLESIENKKHK